jgi:hypothetical protein
MASEGYMKRKQYLQEKHLQKKKNQQKDKKYIITASCGGQREISGIELEHFIRMENLTEDCGVTEHQFKGDLQLFDTILRYYSEFKPETEPEKSKEKLEISAKEIDFIENEIIKPTHTDNTLSFIEHRNKYLPYFTNMVISEGITLLETLMKHYVAHLFREALKETDVVKRNNMITQIAYRRDAKPLSETPRMVPKVRAPPKHWIYGGMDREPPTKAVAASASSSSSASSASSSASSSSSSTSIDSSSSSFQKEEEGEEKEEGSRNDTGTIFSCSNCHWIGGMCVSHLFIKLGWHIYNYNHYYE